MLQLPVLRTCVNIASTAIGFNVETVTYKNVKFQGMPVGLAAREGFRGPPIDPPCAVWDLGGQTSIRPYWRCYYANTDAIIYVIDACDKERISTSKEELMAMLDEEEIQNAALLVFANKQVTPLRRISPRELCSAIHLKQVPQDMEGAMTPAEVSAQMGLGDLKGRNWQIFKTSAVTGEGLQEGLDWYVAAVQYGVSEVSKLVLAQADQCCTGQVMMLLRTFAKVCSLGLHISRATCVSFCVFLQ